jgi:hypothetical protein
VFVAGGPHGCAQIRVLVVARLATGPRQMRVVHARCVTARAWLLGLADQKASDVGASSLVAWRRWRVGFVANVASAAGGCALRRCCAVVVVYIDISRNERRRAR